MSVLISFLDADSHLCSGLFGVVFFSSSIEVAIYKMQLFIIFNFVLSLPLAGFPPPPSHLSGLSEEELRTMEGAERANVEARIQWLRDIQALLDGAMVLIGQYNQVASSMG